MKVSGLLILFLALASCRFNGDTLDKAKLPGRYVFQIWGRDTLDVYSDGMYSYYKWSEGRRLRNSGTWKYEEDRGQVAFENFSFLTDSVTVADSTFLPRGWWVSRIETKGEEIRFVYASDIQYGYFLRVGPLDDGDLNK
jgi:hypothetical protein